MCTRLLLSIIFSACLAFPSSGQDMALAIIQTGSFQEPASKISLIDALDNLAEQHQLFFSYDVSTLKSIKVDAKSLKKSQNVQKKLKNILADVGLAYKKVGESTYVIFIPSKEEKSKIEGKSKADDVRQIEERGSLDKNRTNELSPIVPTIVGNTDFTVRGQVMDDNGEGLVGATVRSKQMPNRGTISGLNGQYELTVSSPDDSLIVSYLGYETARIGVNGQSVVDIQMKQDLKTLDEVVVVGYGTKRKKDLVGSISTIDAARLEKRDLKTVGEALQGEIAGVQITNNGKPGEQAVIRIRGYNSLNNNRPLILVDGIEVSRLYTVDPNDIESISVLKDAASAAIYGFRASNGVVLITTKKGVRGTSKLTYDGYIGWQSATNTVDMLNAEQYVNLLNEAAENAGLNPIYRANEVAEWVGENGTDWQDEVLQTGLMQNHYLNYSGGSENSNYSLSLGYLNQEGIYIDSYFDRYNAKMTSEHTFKKKLRIGQTLAFNYGKQDKGGDFYISRTFMMPPTVPATFEDGSYGFDPKGATNGILKNPVAMSELIQWEVIQNHVYGNIYADLEILEGLNFRTTVRFDRRIEEKDYYEPEYQLGTFFQESFADVADFKDITWDWDNVLTYKKLFAEKHFVTATLGSWTRRHDNNYFLAKGFDFPSQYVTVLDFVSVQNREIQGNRTGYRMLSYFGKLDYIFENKYFVSATYRRDGSSRFAKGNRFGNFPSVGIGWRVSEEKFMDNLPIVSELKLRGSWGLLGNSDIGDFEHVSLVAFGLDYTFGNANTSGGAPVNLANEDIQWETTEQIDIGIDLGLLNDRIGIKADYFRKNTRDILYPVPIPATSGAANAPRQNVGQVENKGWEFELKYNDKIGDLGISVGGNVAFIKNEVVDFNGISFTTGREGYSHIFIEGSPLRSLYGYRTAGVFQNEEQLNSLPHWQDAAPGDLIYVDVNGDGEISPDDRTILGNSIPNVTYGATLDLSFKGFDISALIQGVSGNNVMLANANFGGGRGFFNFWENLVAERANRWHGEGTSNTQPRLYFRGDPGKNNLNSDFFIEDASYFRLKNLQIGYTIPKVLATKIGLSRLRIYAGGTNLWTVTKYPGFDPEIAMEASDSFGWEYPMPKTTIMGLTIDF